MCEAPGDDPLLKVLRGIVFLLCFLWLCFRATPWVSGEIISQVNAAEVGINLENNLISPVRGMYLELLGISG